MAEHNKLGKWGEQVVEEHLVVQGYAIRDRNWRVGHLEIDLVVTRGDEIAFVEVKTRRSKSDNPCYSLTSAKLSRLVRAGNAYLSMLKIALRPRFDVAFISGDEHSYNLEYIEDAFRPGLKTY